MQDPTPIVTIQDFGEVLRQARKAARLTQDDLALAIGSTRRLVSEMENGKRGVSLETALAALRELGLKLRIGVSS